MANIGQVLNRQLWSERTQAALECLLVSFLPLLIAVVQLSTDEQPSLTGWTLAALAVGIGQIVAAIGILCHRRWAAWLGFALAVTYLVCMLIIVTSATGKILGCLPLALLAWSQYEFAVRGQNAQPSAEQKA